MTRLLLCFSCLWLLTGCATWVNIPAQRGDMASHDPNSASARNITVAALAHAIKKYPPGEKYLIIMPEGTNLATLQRMVEQLPAGAAYAADPDDQLPVFRVAGIRIRGWSGQVDIVPPAGPRPKRLLSVYLKHDIEGWYAYRDHLWNMPLDKALLIARPAPRIEAQPEQPPAQPPQPTAPTTEQPQPPAPQQQTPAPDQQQTPPPQQPVPPATPADQPQQQQQQPQPPAPQFIDENQPVEITPPRQGVKWEQ